MSELEPIAQVKCIELPWMIAASATNFELNVVENNGCRLLVDTFWGLHYREERQYQRVSIQFDRVAAAFMGAIRCEGDYGGLEAYDWSTVFIHPKNEKELEDWLEYRASKWASTGLATNSHFYQIIGSKWAKEYSGRPRHFLLRGSDCYVEILASNFTWSIVSVEERR